MFFFFEDLAVAPSRAWVLKVHLQESWIFFLSKNLAVNLGAFPEPTISFHFNPNKDWQIEMMFWCFVEFPQHTHFFVHWFISHSFTFHQTSPLAQKMRAALMDHARNLQVYHPLAAALVHRLRGPEKYVDGRLGFLLWNQRLFFGCFLSLYCSFCLFVCVVCFSPLPKKWGCFVTFEEVNKIYTVLYLYLFLFNLWLNCSTILRVIDHQQLTELW